MHRFKRCLAGLSMAAALSAALFPTTARAASPDIPLNAAHFPDSGFRALMRLYADANGNGTLSAAERGAVFSLDLSGWGLSDLRGIEHFTSLTLLNCDSNRLKSLDVSALNSLASLSCVGNSLTQLKLPAGKALKEVSCGRNSLSCLDVSRCTGLTTLKVPYNRLESLDLSSNTALSTVVCSDNELTELRLPASAALSEVSCAHNRLTDLDLHGTGVQTADLSINDFRSLSLDAPSLTSLKLGWCENLQCLDLSGCGRLQKLQAEEMSSMGALDLSACGRLELADVHSGGLTELTLPRTGALSSLYAYGNRLSSVDLTGCAEVMTVWLFTQVNTHCTAIVSAAQKAAGIAPGTGTTVSAVPAAPTLTLSYSGGQPRLSWGAVDDADRYQIFRREDGTAWSRIKTLEGLSYTDTTAQDGKQYQYRVRAYAAGPTTLFSPYSAVQKTKLPAVPVPKAPASLSVKNTTGVRLEWPAVKGADGYQIYRKAPGGSYERVRTTANTAWVDTDAPSGTVFTYKVRAYTGTHGVTAVSPCTKAVSVTALSRATLKAAADDTGIRLSWSKVKGATGYQIYKRLPGQTWTRVRTTAGTSWHDTDVAFGGTFEYKVRAYKKKNGAITYAAFSAAVSRPFDVPVRLQAAAKSSGIRLTWNPIPGAKGYQIYRKAPGGSFVRIKTTALTAYTDTSAAAGILYTYKVRAYRAGSSHRFGAFSRVVSAAR